MPLESVRRQKLSIGCSVRMIVREQILALLLEACPSFGDSCAESVNDHGSELLYVHAGEFAHHLLQLHQAGRDAEFPAVGVLIERLHSEGEHFVRELATIGFLESIQNVWSHSTTSPDAFLSYLGPEGTKSWQDLKRFWSGEIPFIPDRYGA